MKQLLSPAGTKATSPPAVQTPNLTSEQPTSVRFVLSLSTNRRGPKRLINTQSMPLLLANTEHKRAAPTFIPSLHVELQLEPDSKKLASASPPSLTC